MRKRAARFTGAAGLRQTPAAARWVIILLLGAWVPAMPASAQTATTTATRPSPVPLLPGLETPVQFWKQIFATYSTHQVVIHDTEHLDRIYEVLDFRRLAESGASDAEIEADVNRKVQDEKERVRALLLRLHQLGPHPVWLSDEEGKISALFAGVNDPDKYLEAAAGDRIRAQRGLRERFAAGVEMSRRYLPEMERIFRRAGLPWQLTRLPLVESCFNVRAYSKAGAAGIWQFMPATGRDYLRIDRVIDQRRDPLASTTAAAQYLKANYALLGNWPLAITAYNHGRAGMAHAVATVGSANLADIIRRYHGPAFKFASRNFYAEFLAALDVEQHFSDYFGELAPARPLRVDTVVVPEYVNFKALARAARTSPDVLADLNPALTPAVVEGRLNVPKGYHAHVPPGARLGFKARFTAMVVATRRVRHRHTVVAAARRAHRRHTYVTHRVRPGQTLLSIARRYRTTVAAIRRRNNLRNVSRLRAGQHLIIPAAG